MDSVNQNDAKMLVSIITWLITGGGFGLTIWLMKKWFEGLDGRVEDVEKQLKIYNKNYHACRESLSERFAEKKTLESVFERLGIVEGIVNYFKGKLNGFKVP